MNEQNQVHVSFLIGKFRVIPLKHMTIPRLEITAALVAVKVSKFLNKELKLKRHSKVSYFCKTSRGLNT